MENNNNINKKIVNASASNAKVQTKTISNAKQENKSELYSKKYYIMFFSIMLVTFLITFWLCNYTKLKEMFQIMALLAFSIALAEYLTRRYINS